MTIAIRDKRKGGTVMSGTIHARMKHGILEPLEKIDLSEGEEVMVTILEVPSRRDFEAFRRSAGAWKGTIDAKALIRNIYADRLISTRRRPRL